jgi:hypothetical protein
MDRKEDDNILPTINPQDRPYDVKQTETHTSEVYMFDKMAKSEETDYEVKDGSHQGSSLDDEANTPVKKPSLLTRYRKLVQYVININISHHNACI